MLVEIPSCLILLEEVLEEMEMAVALLVKKVCLSIEILH